MINCSQQSINNQTSWIIFLVNLRACLKIPKSERGNQNPYIKEQTTQWPTEKRQENKRRSTKHTHKIKDRVTRPPLKPGRGLNSGAAEG